MSLDLKGVSRRFVKLAGGVAREFRLTGLESLAVTQVEPEYAEVAKSGSRFAGGNSIIANGIAPVTAIPTTTATLALFNAAADGGFSILVDNVVKWLGSGTAAAGATLLACVSNGKIATPLTAHATGYAAAALSRKGLTPLGIWGVAVAVPAGTVWWGVGSDFQLAAADVGQGPGAYNIKGALVPPGYAMGFAILSAAGTTPLYGLSAMWSELELDLE